MPDPFLPYGRQLVEDDDVAAVVQALRSDYLTTGPTVGRFEQALAAATGAGHAVVMNSGTAALHAAYFAAGLGPGQEVITTPMTFAATANAALYLGATVRLADIEPDTGNIDPAAVEALVTARTRLIVPVDFAGHPADYGRLGPIARRSGATMVADAAHALGACWQGRSVGTLADLSTASFHPVKAITTGEGGAVLTADAELAARVRRFHSHGIVRDPAVMTRADGPWYYEDHDLGFNYRLTDVQCALGLSQLAKLGRFVARRRRIAARYSAELGDVKELALPVVRPDVEPAWHLYVVRVTGDPARRRPFFDRLRQLGLGVQVHYIPVHYHPLHQPLGYGRGSLPVAEDFYARCVSLPIYPAMSDQDVDSSIRRVRQAVRDVL